MSCEKEYIERDKIGLTDFEIILCKGSYKEALLMLLEKIKSIPAADVRPVVLCKDCKDSYEWTNMDGHKIRFCSYIRNVWNCDTDRMVSDDDFCKWGVKREESL